MPLVLFRSQLTPSQ
jgi:hypothetical protein